MADGPQLSTGQRDTAADSRDVELLERVAGGDREAFRELYAGYYHAVLRFIYRITGQLESAQEGVNDVMLVVWRSCSRFERKSKVATWIMGIAYRKGLKLLSNSKRWDERFKAGTIEEWNEPSAPDGELSNRGDLRDLLEHGMRQLPPQQRAVVELTYFYGYSYEEIANIVDCPVNTVKTRMFHARANLKMLLPGLGRDDLL